MSTETIKTDFTPILEFEEIIEKYNIPKEDPFYALMLMVQGIKNDVRALKEERVISKERIVEALSSGISEKIEDKINISLDGIEINARTAPLDYDRISEFTSQVVAEHIHNALTEIFNGEGDSESSEENNKSSLLGLWGKLKKKGK